MMPRSEEPKQEERNEWTAKSAPAVPPAQKASQAGSANAALRSDTGLRHRRKLNGWSSFSVAANLALLAGSLLILFPFIWMVLGAFKPAAELSRAIPTVLPENPTFANFTTLFATRPFGRYFLNSLGITLITVALILFTSSLMGYVFARGNFIGSKTAFAVIISSMIVPFEVLVVPLFLIVSSLGWQDSYQALIAPYVIDAFGIYLFREFISNVPRDYFDAAKVDGASEWIIYRRIVTPLCKPVFASLAIFSFVYIWDQLIWPIVIISSDAHRTLPMGIALLSTESGARFDLVLAAALLGVVPPLIVFLIFQRRIVKGVVMAGLKG